MAQHERIKRAEIMPEHLERIKNSLKRALALVGLIIITLSLSGCDNFVGTGVSAKTISTKQTIIETTNSENITEIKTIEPPEDGWTLEELLNVTNIYGQTLKLPCTLNDMNENFSYDLQDGLIDKENKSISIILKYNNESIASIVLNDCNNISDISEHSVVCKLFFSSFLNENNKENIFINGISLNGNDKDILKKLGNPDITEKNLITYCDKNDKSEILKISLDDDGKILGVLFIY